MKLGIVVVILCVCLFLICVWAFLITACLYPHMSIDLKEKNGLREST